MLNKKNSIDFGKNQNISPNSSLLKPNSDFLNRYPNPSRFDIVSKELIESTTIDNLKINSNIKVAIIIPDKDIIPGAKNLSPAYFVFDNYEKILKWNRSLRFALAVCTLKENFKHEI